MARLAELGIVVMAALAPLFVLASEIDGDEFAKAASGAVMAAATASVVAVYRTWKAGGK